MPLWAQGCASLMSFILASRSRAVAVRSPRAGHPEFQPRLQNLKLGLGSYMSPRLVTEAQLQRIGTKGVMPLRQLKLALALPG